ncbi:GCN5-like N-acetyltransferaser [Sphaerotilus natans subsp. natans DSM 6575]|uniref:GCN5-like N-acetyltransferaser n=1 Tax=Sphaerotilus natans subsp. natans DSM 6575 TaxID=1286631 RepID=A0A059KJU3_9BURK|nr:hypothetical protein [Sphaerotilus natans]KDB51737.1 GCN5-like N-acetyltransferaser [Sphaerotilus natans subsp. natans DSM 6575]SIR96768.1 hypothetical protein SAMN05421778_12453 [Sphaerotilus natans]
MSACAGTGLDALQWSDAIDAVDWDELSALYRAAPLGDKPPQALRTVFSNSLHCCLVRDAAGRLVGAIERGYLAED